MASAYCGVRTDFPNVISGLRIPIAIRAAQKQAARTDVRLVGSSCNSRRRSELVGRLPQTSPCRIGTSRKGVCAASGSLRLPILGSLLENYFVGRAKCPWSKATVWRCPRYFRFTSESRHPRQGSVCLKRVESRCGAVALGRTYLLPALSF